MFDMRNFDVNSIDPNQVPEKYDIISLIPAPCFYAAVKVIGDDRKVEDLYIPLMAWAFLRDGGKVLPLVYDKTTSGYSVAFKIDGFYAIMHNDDLEDDVEEDEVWKQ